MGRRFSKALDVSLEEQDDDSTVVSLHNDGAHVFACRPLHWHSAALAREDSSRLSLYNFFPPSLREGLNMNLSNLLVTLTVLYPVQEVDRATLRA